MSAGIGYQVIHRVFAGRNHIVEVSARCQHLAKGDLEARVGKVLRTGHQVSVGRWPTAGPVRLKFGETFISPPESQMRAYPGNDLCPDDRLGDVIDPPTANPFTFVEVSSLAEMKMIGVVKALASHCRERHTSKPDPSCKFTSNKTRSGCCRGSPAKLPQRHLRWPSGTQPVSGTHRWCEPCRHRHRRRKPVEKGPVLHEKNLLHFSRLSFFPRRPRAHRLLHMARWGLLYLIGYFLIFISQAKHR